MIRRSDFFKPVWIITIFLAGAGLLCVVSRAAEDAGGMPAIRRIYVPADQPTKWPPGDRQPIELAEFEKLVANAKAPHAGPGSVSLQRAEYSATLSDNALVGGVLTIDVTRHAPDVAFLEFDPMRLAVSQLRWDDRAAVWGTTPQGKCGVLIDRQSGQLHGDWRAAGRTIGRHIEFDLSFAPAVVTQLALRLPPDTVPECSAGDVLPPQAAEPAGWKLWTVELGSRTSCRLTILRSSPSASPSPLLLARTDLTCVLRPEVVRFQADCSFEALESPVQELRLELSSDLQVVSVSYGDNSGIPWRIEESTPGRQLMVMLPDPLLGTSLPLRVQGITRINGLSAWSVPQLRLVGAVFTEGQLTLRVNPPLKVAGLKVDGYRQNLFTNSAAEGETFIFRQLRAAPAAVVTFNDSPLDIACRSFTEVHTGHDEWTAMTRLDLTARTASTFSIAAQIPAEWEIVDVDLEPQLSPNNLTGWDVQRRGDGQQSLTLQFRESLSSDNSHRIRVSYRRAAVPLNQAVTLPVPIVEDCDSLGSLVALIRDADSSPAVDPAGTFERVFPQDLMPEWATSGLFNPAWLTSTRAEESVHLLSRQKQPHGKFFLTPASNPPPQLETISTGIRHNMSPVIGGLKLMAQMSLQSEGINSYWADYEIMPGHLRFPFRWKLAENAVLVTAEIDGRHVFPQQEQGEYALELPDSADVQTVRLQYRTPSSRRFGANSRTIVVPQCLQPVPEFVLALTLPPQARLTSAPMELSSGVPVASPPGWTVLLEPFAPRPGDAPFHPFRLTDWQRLITGVPPVKTALQNIRAEMNVVWSGRQVTRDGQVPEIHIVLWDTAVARGLIWLAFFLSLLGGIVGRIIRPTASVLAAICWLNLTAAGAFVLPAVWTEVAGACFAGAVFAIIFPQKLLVRAAPPIRSRPPSIPSGSTRSFVPAATCLFVSLALTCLTTAIAQEKLVATPPSSSTKSTFDILIPLGTDGKPAGTTPRAYVPHELLSRLQQAAPERPALPPYLISSVAYEGTIDSGTAIKVKATLQVIMLARAASVAVELPLSKVYLGEDACRVDGDPQPIRLDADRKAYVVDLPGTGEQPASHRIELQLHLPVESDGGFSRAEFGIPAVAASRLSFSTPLSLQSLELIDISAGREPQSLFVESQSPYTAAIGPVSAIQIRWSDKAPPREMPPQLQATVSSLVDVSPAVLQVRHQVEYTVLEGTVSSLKWKLPSGVPLAIRTVRSTDLLHYAVEADAAGERFLVIDFSRPQTRDFAIAATLVLPVATVDAMRLPVLPPAGNDPAPTGNTVVRLNQVAFRSHPDSRLDVLGPLGSVLRSRAVDDFLQSWEYVGTRPQSAWLLDSNQELSLKLQPFEPAFAVRSQTVARVDSHRLDITYAAEIDTQVATAFRYQLEVDPRLKITSVSVFDDGAERLLRWSRSGNQVELFLNDKTIGTQQLTLRAAMPLGLPGEFDLPTVGVSEGAILETRLIVLRDEGVDVQVVLPEDLPSLALPADQVMQENEAFVGHYELPAVVLLRISRRESTSETESPRAVTDVDSSAAVQMSNASAEQASSSGSQNTASVAAPTGTTPSGNATNSALALLSLVAAIVVIGCWSRARCGIVWLQQHEPAAWLALGLVWWLWCQPSIIGICLILFAAVRAWPLRRKSDAADFTLASDIQGQA